MAIRLLDSEDATAFDRFLAQHRDSSMFLRSNASRAGLVYRGELFQAVYMAAFRGDDIVGVVAHGTTGMLSVQAPESPEELARACVGASGRPVKGLSGPLEQVRRARSALGLANTVAVLDADEGLYALDLCELTVPEALASGRISCRFPLPEDREKLYDWRVAYDVETLGGRDSEETRKRSAAFLDAQIASGHAWVAIEKGRVVSLSSFNAALPDIVQLGGIYTPPELRGFGYARAAVAASLQAARAQGVERSVLFTKNPSAVRCYEALGFRREGDFGLVLFS